LAPRNNLHGAFLNGPLRDVNRRIRGYYLPPAFLVAMGQCPNRVDDLLFDQATHLQDSVGERLQIGVEYRRRMSKSNHRMTSIAVETCRNFKRGLFLYRDSMTTG
jgi:hypothetical protein